MAPAFSRADASDMSDPRVPYIEVRRVRWFAVALAVTAIGLAGCGDDDGDRGVASAVPDIDRISADRGAGGEAILIKTRVRVARGGGGGGEVLRGSRIGDSAFCPGGRFRDRQGGAGLGTVVKTFRCPNGRLTITFSPVGEQSCARQSSSWRIVNGSGRFEGLRGHGRMKVRFGTAAPSEGRETFTGKVAR
jgi:hypothetical protein